MRAHIAIEIDILAIAAHGAALGIDAECRLARLCHLEVRLCQRDAVVVGKVVTARGGQRFDRLPVGVEVDGAKIGKKEVGIVAARSVAVCRSLLHLRVEPVGERREATEQQHRRPGDQAIDEGPRAVHRISLE